MRPRALCWVPGLVPLAWLSSLARDTISRPMAAYGLYTHIQSNKRRSIALLIGLFFLIYLLVYAGALLGEALTIDAPPDELLRRALSDALYAAPWATLGTALWIFIAYKFHQSMIDAVTGGHEVTRQEEPRLYNLLENLCISRGITTPKLKVIEDDSLNAFATGMNDKQYSITVTSGLINALADAGSVELTKNPDAMISALRKIEGRGELPDATSAVMEMCIDNPREGFSNIFDTHPPVDARVAALVKFAGGHDPGPLALPAPSEAEADEGEDADQGAPSGPWGGSQPAGGSGEPFLPSRPPVELGSSPSADSEPGPWGPHRK